MNTTYIAGMPMNSSKFPPYIASLFVLMLSSVPSVAWAMPDIGDMFANFASSSVSLMNLVVGAGFVLGILISGKSLMSFKEYSESGGRTQLKTPIGLFFVGICLIALPGSINVATETLSLGANSGTNLFSEGGGGGGIPGMDAAMRGVLLFVKLVGHIAIFRGFLIVKRAAEGQQGGEMGRALTHILGGAAAVNINQTINILANTVGMPMPL